MRSVLVFVAVGAVSQAQSFEWSRDFAVDGAAWPVLSSSVVASVVFDDGSGPALFVAGHLSAAGHATAGPIAKWNGSTWAPIPSTLTYTLAPSAARITTLAVYDDGAGPALYAAGTFDSIDGVAANSIAKRTGSTWRALAQGMLGPLTAMRALDFGAGPVLCVGAEFNAQINGNTATTAAMWNGASWSLIGTTVAGNVYDFAVFDDGSGARLYVGGQVLQFPGAPSYASVARFNGAVWETVGGATGGGARALEVFDDGTGPALYAGGLALDPGMPLLNALGKWDGTGWSDVGGGLGSAQYLDVDDMRVYDDGSGAALYIAGQFSTAGGAPARNLARWDGTALHAVGSPDGLWFEYTTAAYGARAWTLAEFDAGSGPELVVGGLFSRAGGRVVSSIARWDGALWSPLDDPGVELGPNGVLSVLASYDVGNGPELLASGQFDAVGSLPSAGLASFDGSTWTNIGLGAQREVLAAESLDDGSGAALYIGGTFDTVDGLALPRLAKWDGAQWSGLITTFTPSVAGVHAMETYDAGLGAGRELYTGGNFTSLNGVSTRRIARWDGNAWQSVGALGADGTVRALVVHDDGTGSKLYAGGGFLHMDGQQVFGVARWSGVAWEPVGLGFNSAVSHFAVFDAGSGAELYAAGSFTQAPPNPSVRGIARWDGVAWQPVGNGVGSTNINALEVSDDGNGDALYMGGGFHSVDNLPLRFLVRWDGSSWSSAGDFDSTILTLSTFDDGSGLGAALYAGGIFSTVDDRVSVRIAKFERSCEASSYCTSGVTSNGCVPTISGTGTPSASATSGFKISVASVEGQKQGHIFYGLNGPNAAPWGTSSHFLCVKAPSQRTGTQDSGGTSGGCNGAIALDWNAYCATHPGSLGVPFNAGTSVWAQLYFRDPAGPKTTALSNGLMFTVCP